MSQLSILNFIRESNKIENIIREPSEAEIQEFTRFYYLKELSVQEFRTFVSVYQPNAVLRNRRGLNVRIGNYYPPVGGKEIEKELEQIVCFANSRDITAISTRGELAYDLHHRYESLHPFTDGNGRSGRMLWIWIMKEAHLGFLHTWYYQSLQYHRK